MSSFEDKFWKETPQEHALAMRAQRTGESLDELFFGGSGFVGEDAKRDIIGERATAPEDDVAKRDAKAPN